MDGSMIGGRRRRQFLGLFLFSLVTAAGVSGGDAMLHLECLSRERGLSQSTVTGIIQDRKGYLWFATENGLNQFDGNEIRVYRHDPGNPETLSSNYATKLILDREDRLWVLTSEGLNRFLEETRSFKRYPAPVPDPADPLRNWIAVCFIDHRGYPAYANKDRFYRYRPETDAFDPWGQGIAGLERAAGTTFGAMAVAGGTTFWGAGPGKVAAFPIDGEWGRVEAGKKEFSFASDGHASQPSTPEDAPANKLLVTRRGGVYVFRESRIYELQTGTRFFSPIDLPGSAGSMKDPIPDFVFEDNEGVRWFAGREGLYQTQPEGFRFLPFSHSGSWACGSPPGKLLSLYQDRDGVLWMGTDGSGVLSVPLRGRGFDQYFPRFEGASTLGSAVVRAFYQDRDDSMLVGTIGGLYRFDLAQKAFVPLGNLGDPRQWREREIWSIARDLQGNLWIGTDQGLEKVSAEGGSVRIFRHEPSDPTSIGGNRVRSLYVDRGGRVWAGTNGSGFSLFLPESDDFRNFAAGRGDAYPLGSMYVNCFLEDREGRLWVGASGGFGLIRPETGEFLNGTPAYQSMAKLADAFIVCFHQARNGDIWIGTFGGGLYRWDADSQTLSHYGEQDGFSGQMVVGILEDRNNRLWTATERGIACFDPGSQKTVTFALDRGTMTNEFNSGAHAQARSGEMFFGGNKGFNAFHPNEIRENRTPPSPVLTDLLLFNQAVAIQPQPDPADERGFRLPRDIDELETLTLTHRQSVVGFAFAGLHSANPRGNRYAYKLEGFDRDWIENKSDQRVATYTGLKPGSYEFRVKAGNADGYWRERPRRLRVEVLPPFWQTWWAYALYGLIALSAGVVYIRSHRLSLARERQVVSELDRLHRLKDGFLANTSHELRTPLNGIIGLSESLRDGDDGEIPGPAKATLDTIISSSRRLSHLIDDILDFSQLQTGHLSLDKKPVDLRALCELVSGLLKPQADQKKLCLANGVPHDLSLVEADEVRLQQVLINLMGNALKFTERGGISVNAHIEGDRVWVGVTDTGIGIAEDHIDKIFLAYGQCENPRNRNAGGLGLGLAITKELVALHGGTLSVSSKPGAGTTFSFTLPLAVTTKAEPDRGSEPAARIVPQFTAVAVSDQPAVPSFESGGQRILIVDDDPVNRQVLVSHLGHAGYRPIEAESGEAGLRQLAQDTNIDLVLLDIMMPRMSGYETCERIRETQALHRLPIIFLTSLSHAANMVEGFDRGANDYLAKPIDKGELLARVKTQLDLRHVNRHLERQAGDRTVELREKHHQLQNAYRQLVKQAGELKEQSRRLEELDLWKTQFFTDFSHEFRTPLSLIIGPLEDLIERPFPTEKPVPKLEMMLRNARRLLDAVNQVLDISKIRAGRKEINPHSADLVACLRTWLEGFKPLAETKHIDLQFECERETATIRFDADSMERVFSNLLSNALKFTAVEGAILVKVEEEEPEWLRVSVRDSGMGIPADELPFVFKRYYQGAQSEVLRTPSSGLGLALAKELVELHGGRIQVWSEWGKGAEFSVHLPMWEREPASPPLMEEGPPPVSRLSFPVMTGSFEPLNQSEDVPDPGEAADDTPALVLVEDDAELRAFLSSHLKKRYRVLASGDGEEGLTLCLSHVPDLVICDLMLPGIEGTELCRRLKTDERTCHIPVLMLTALASLDNKLSGLEQGADDYLVKPVPMRELDLRIKNLLDTRSKLWAQIRRKSVWSEPDEALPSADAAFLAKASTLVSHSIGDPLFGTEALAQDLAFSRRQLHRKFMAITGSGPGQFIRDQRMRKAARMLTRNACSIAEAAYAVGYKNAPYFAKQFKEFFGQTPTDFSKRFTEDNAPDPVCTGAARGG